MLEKLVSLLGIYKALTEKMSDRYANASVIIPEIITIRTTLSSKEIQKCLGGIGGTITKLLLEMKARYAIYLDNPNLILATFLDPRYKDHLFKKEASDSPRAPEKVDKLVMERYFKHEKAKSEYEAKKKEEEEKNVEQTNRMSQVKYL